MADQAVEKSVFEKSFEVMSGQDGSYLVRQGHHAGFDGRIWAFSSLGDLLAWLTRQAAIAPPQLGLGGRALTFSVGLGGDA